MDVKKVTQELREKYPGKKIVMNKPDNPTEIICEIEPPGAKANQSVAVAVIDETIEHYHRETMETYEVLKGELKINKDGVETVLREGETIVIHPGERHKAEGHGTWIKVTSTPPWSDADHFVVGN